MEIWGDRLNLKSCPTIFDERSQTDMTTELQWTNTRHT